MKRFAKWLFVVGLLGYLALAGAIYADQKELVYHPTQAVPTPAESATPEAQIVYFRTSDGLKLRSWYIPAKSGFPTVVLFHGNAGHVGYQGRLVRPLIDKGYGAFLLEYRGYGGNPGTPDEAGLYADARGAIAYLNTLGITDSEMIFYGRSLGTGVAVQMATEYDPEALVLQAPYTSIPDVGAKQYWYLPVHLLATEKYDSLAKIGKVRAPLFIFHGADDGVIPVSQSEQLFNAANEPKERLVIPGAGHSRGVFSNGGTNGVLRFVDAIRRNGGNPSRIAGGQQ